MERATPTTRRRRWRRRSETSDGVSIGPHLRADGETTREASKRPRRWRRRLIWSALGLLVFLWLLPVLIAKTPLLNALARKASRVASLRGELSLDSASLGWFSPVRLEGVVLRDANEAPLVTIGSIETQHSLLNLLTHPSHVGKVRIESPHVAIVMTADGSNLEEALADLLANRHEPSSAGLEAELEIVDGQIDLRDSVSGETWTVNELVLSVATASSQKSPLAARLSATIAAGDEPPKPVSVVFRTPTKGAKTPPASNDALSETQEGSEAPDDQGLLTVNAEAAPLGVAQVLLRRIAPGVLLSGTLAADFEARWSGDTWESSSAEVDGAILVEDLALAGPFLVEDEFRLRQIEAPLQLELDQGTLRTRRLDLKCDLGEVTLRAETPDFERVVRQTNWVNVLKSIAATRGKLHAKFDLADLAARLPNTLRVREGIELEEGPLELTISSHAQPESVERKHGRADTGSAWRAILKAGRIRGAHEGREITWEKPFALTLDAHDSAIGLQIDRLTCESDFLRLEATGSLQEFEIHGTHDLAKLSSELAKFLDLGSTRLAGAGTIEGKGRIDDEEGFSADAGLTVAGFVWSFDGAPSWTEKTLAINASAKGVAKKGRLEQLDEARLEIQTGGDRCAIWLAEASSLAEASGYPLEVSLSGDLGTWRKRIAAFVPPLADWHSAGAVDMNASLLARGEGILVEQVALDAQDLRAEGPGLWIVEPRLKFEGSEIAFDWKPSLEAKRISIAGTGISGNVQDLRCSFPQGESPMMAVRSSWRADLATVSTWLWDPGQPPEWGVSGKTTAEIEVAPENDGLAITIHAVGKNVTGTLADGETWREPQIELQIGAQYQARDERLRIDVGELNSAPLSLAAAGEISGIATAPYVDFEGEIAYDWERLRDWARLFSKLEATIEGQGTKKFKVQGPWLAWTASESNGRREFTAEAGADWRRAEIFGFEMGPAEIDARLNKGQLSLLPLDLDVNGGRLRLAPTIRFSPGPAQLRLAPGKILENVRITPETCDQALMFVVPYLARATEIEGECSLDSTECSIPFDNPSQAEAAGSLTIHSVEIGSPSPMIQVLTVLTRQRLPIRLRRENTIDFEVSKGRVYHEGLDLEFGDVKIQSRGYVGLDHSLDLVATLEAKNAEPVEVPIRGTLEKPEFDVGKAVGRAIENRLEKEVEKRLEKELEKGLGKGLDRLFRGDR